MLIQALRAEAPSNGLNVGIIGWRAGSAEDELDPVTVCPVVQGLRRALRAIVYLDARRQSRGAPGGFQAVQHGEYAGTTRAPEKALPTAIAGLDSHDSCSRRT
jgi:hypothetical protein